VRDLADNTHRDLANRSAICHCEVCDHDDELECQDENCDCCCGGE